MNSLFQLEHTVKSEIANDNKSTTTLVKTLQWLIALIIFK